MSQIFFSLILLFASSSWSLLSPQQPFDPIAGTLASDVYVLGVLINVQYMIWQWFYLHCPVRTSCSYFICRHEMDIIRVYTQLHTSYSEAYPWSYRDGNVTWYLFSCWHAFKPAPLFRGVKMFLLRWSVTLQHELWALCLTWCVVCVWKWSSCLLKESNGLVICTLASCWSNRWRVWFMLTIL